MFGLPASTEFNKRISKQKFYEHSQISTSLRPYLVEQVHLIYWRNKLAATTLNLAKGEKVQEIEVFEIQLNTPHLNEAVLRQIDLSIPYHTLFILTHEKYAQAWIGYKEISSIPRTTLKVTQYFHTCWEPQSELKFNLSGLNMDAVYENLIHHIAGNELLYKQGEILQDSMDRIKTRLSLSKEIQHLETKLRSERQINRQIEINTKLKILRKSLSSP